VGAAQTPAATLTLPGPPRLSAAAVHARLAGHHAETLRALPRTTQGPCLRACRALPGDQEAHQEALHQADQGHEGRLTDHSRHHPAALRGQDQPSMSARLNHKLRGHSGTSVGAGFGCLCAMIPPHDDPRRPAAARPTLAAHPAAAATPTLPRARRRAPHRAGPGLHGRDHLHGPHLHPLGAAAGGRVRLRLGDHLLATLRRVGPRRGLRAAPGVAAG
jgi:hypothetical protein